jgi:hypothetical protein
MIVIVVFVHKEWYYLSMTAEAWVEHQLVREYADLISDAQENYLSMIG